jgi:hypothetical protein
MHEEEGFVPQREVQPLPDKRPISVGAVSVQPNENGIHLRYRYTPVIGAPDRSRRPPVEFEVAVGERARVAYNGRISGYGIEWLYKLSVVTITVGIVPTAGLFMATPEHMVEDLAKLF